YSKSLKSLLVLAFSIFSLLISANLSANETPQNKDIEAANHNESAFDPAKLIMEHIMDAHEFHFFSIGETHISIPLPVIIYSPQRGVSVFSYGEFHHGHEVYNGYKSEEGKIIAVNESGEHDPS
ncbi:hypothetical protein ACSFB2_13005, partial [Glaesserella parasuis]|uniref:hypothetical protein n=1 Tax=Glaesserella parasuis TaxID=738 RepID=UPI003F2D1D5D